MQDNSRLLEVAARYRRAPGTYRLLMMTMAYALENMEERRHLSGGEFLDWLTRMLQDRFGYMGRWLLLHYGLEKPEEVGRAIFELVDAGIFTRREEDTIEDFMGQEVLTERFRVEFSCSEWWSTEGPDWGYLPVIADDSEDEMDWWETA